MNNNFDYSDYQDNKFNEDVVVEKKVKFNNNYNNDFNNSSSDKKNLIKSIILIFIVILVIIGFIVFKGSSSDNNKNNGNDKNNSNNNSEIKEEVPKKKVNIVDMESKTRPYAIMINNHNAARPHAGLSDSYLIYEIMVEGGITRFLALFTQDKDISKIGSIRSARHNYLDYAMENDAIFVHFGWSYIAEADISKLGINHIDGNTFAGAYFYRDRNLGRATEHTVFTTSDNIKKAITNYKYRNTRDKNYLLNYTTDEVDLSKKSESQVANNVSIKYSYYQTSSYEYNSEEKVYYRFMGGKKHTDLTTGEQYKFKNIIVYGIHYDTYPDKLQDLKNIGTGNGYYITNGYATPITWEKTSRDGQTIYKYKDGKEIDVSDGNTFIQIYPSNGGNLTIN